MISGKCRDGEDDRDWDEEWKEGFAKSLDDSTKSRTEAQLIKNH